MKKRLSKRTIDAIKPGDKDVFVWDTELTGFILKVTPKGRRVFIYQYRNNRGLRRYTIGPMGKWTPEEARTEAGRLAGIVSKGGDPQADKVAKRKAGTVDDMLDSFLDDHAKPHLKPDTYKEYKRLLDRHVRPAVGKIKAEELDTADIDKLHLGMKSTPRQANVVLAIVSKVCEWSKTRSFRKGLPNPVNGVRRFAERSRKVKVLDADIAKIGKKLGEIEKSGEVSQVFIDALRMVIISQLRLIEVLRLRPEQIDTENSQLDLGVVKQKERAYPVGAVVLAYLANFPRNKDHAWLFPSPKNPEKHLSKSALQHFWADVREAAGLSHLRIHDLRHVSGTFAGSAGASALLVKDFLAHSSVTTSQRYVHGEKDPRRALADKVEGRIDAALRGSEAEVIPLEKITPAS